MEVYGDDWMARLQPNPRPIDVWADRYAPPMSLEIRTARGNPSGMLAEELRAFCRVAAGEQPVPTGATYADAIQVQRWLETLAAQAGSTST